MIKRTKGTRESPLFAEVYGTLRARVGKDLKVCDYGLRLCVCVCLCARAHAYICFCHHLHAHPPSIVIGGKVKTFY